MRVMPATRLGRWAVGLAIAGLLLIGAWTVMGPLGGFPGLVVAFAGGIVALVAITRRHERALSVFAALVPFLNAVAFLIAEIAGVA